MSLNTLRRRQATHQRIGSIVAVLMLAAALTLIVVVLLTTPAR